MNCVLAARLTRLAQQAAAQRPLWSGNPYCVVASAGPGATKWQLLSANCSAAPKGQPALVCRHLTTDGDRRDQRIPGRQGDLASRMRPYLNQMDYFGTLKHFFCAPKSYLILGTAGLIPFAFPTLYCVVAGVFYPYLIHLQVVYGASILAFLGGVRWGHLLGTEGIKASTYDVTMSTVPSLVAVGALLLPHPWMDMAVMLSLLGAGFYDGIWQAYPVWFRAIRLGLTTVAVLSIFIALLGRMILPRPKKFPS